MTPDHRARWARILRWMAVACLVQSIGVAFDVWRRFGLPDSSPYWALDLARFLRPAAQGTLALLAAHGFQTGNDRGRRLVRAVVPVAALFHLDGLASAFDPEVATRSGLVLAAVILVGFAYAYVWLDRPDVRAAFDAATPSSRAAPQPAYVALILIVISAVALGTIRHEVGWRRLALHQVEGREQERVDRAARIARGAPVIRLPLDGSAVDAGPQAFPARVAGAPPRFAAGVADQAIVLDGRTNWIELDAFFRGEIDTTPISLGDGATIEMWVAPDEPDAQRSSVETLIVISGVPNIMGIDLVAWPERRSVGAFIVGPDSLLRRSDPVDVSDPGTILARRWTHVAAVYDGTAGTLELFTNGTSVGRASGAPIDHPWVPTSVRVGAYFRNQLFAGRIDDVRCYEYPRAPADIAADAGAVTH